MRLAAPRGSILSTISEPHNRAALFQLPLQTPRKPVLMPICSIVYSIGLPHSTVIWAEGPTARGTGGAREAIGPGAALVDEVVSLLVSVPLPTSFKTRFLLSSVQESKC